MTSATGAGVAVRGGLTMEAAAASLRERALAVLRETLAPWRGRPWALLDFPAYPNAGDSAIWLGTRAALADVGLPAPAYVCDKRTFEPEVLARRVGDGPILVHGGGNFGDVYRSHQRLREEVATRFRRNPMVQLPQSIHFTAGEARDRARRVFGEHPRFRLLVRDEASRDRARTELGLEARLCPDLALGLGPLARRRRGGGGLVWLSRGDAWRRGDAAAGPGLRVSDWPREPVSARRLWASLLARGVRGGLGGALPLRAALARAWEGLARWRCERVVAWLARADVVVTDRLHGHVLCLLLGVPHVVLDDRTGKVHALHATWARGVEGIRAARDAGEAMALARELAGAARPTAG